MRRIPAVLVVTWGALLAVAASAAPAAAADNYAIDTAHSSVSFKAEHMGISWIHGRFNSYSGNFSIDKADPGKSSFEMTIKTDSVDTGNKGRDTHLVSPDYFDAKQFSTITFKSTSVKAVAHGYEVKGDFTMHGQTKPITFTLLGGKEVEFPKGMKRTGFSTDLKIKRSDYGMVDKMPGALGDEVPVSISFEGVRK